MREARKEQKAKANKNVNLVPFLLSFLSAFSLIHRSSKEMFIEID